MKSLLLFLMLLSNRGSSQTVNFDQYFTAKTMRVDVMLAGDYKNTEIFFQQIKQEPYYGGSQKNLIDTFGYGSYKFIVHDLKTDKIIYSRGFSSLFQEWQATNEAKKVKRAFYESLCFPYPNNKVRFEIQTRDRKNNWSKSFELAIDPKDYFIIRENPKHYNAVKIIDSGLPKDKLDIVIIPEGYTKEEMDKFISDSKRFAGYLLNCSPYKEMKDKINFVAIEAPSEESGVDIPGDSIWKNTCVNSTFYTFDSERYLTTFDMKSLHDIAANVPYDQVLLLVNTDKYGGGGVYNYLCEAAADNNFAEYLFCHEFGHAFAGLGDEYYDSEVSVVDYYDTSVEPWEPNLSTLVNFKSKWADMVNPGIPVPTPVIDKYKLSTGAFEGGGYMSKRIYRPCFDCTMKSIKINSFCPVCKKAISKMISFYSE